MDRLIKDIYDDIVEIKGDSLAPLELWYNKLINKKIDDISIGDISRMLRQKVFLSLALSKAMDMLIKDPMDGELYDGELLKQVVNALKNNSIAIDDLQAETFIKTAHEAIKIFDWEEEEYKIEYESLLKEFISIINKK